MVYDPLERAAISQLVLVDLRWNPAQGQKLVVLQLRLVFRQRHLLDAPVQLAYLCPLQRIYSAWFSYSICRFINAAPIPSSSSRVCNRPFSTHVFRSKSIYPTSETMRKVRGLIVISSDSMSPMGKKKDGEIQKYFGQRVRELRKQKDLSQEALALACGLDRTYIGGVKRGERNISLLNIHKIAGALGLPAKDLFDG